MENEEQVLNQVLFERWLGGTSYRDLVLEYSQFTELQVRKRIKEYKNTLATAELHDAVAGDEIEYKMGVHKFIGTVIKRYDNSVMVTMPEGDDLPNDDSRDWGYYKGKTIISDRDYTILNVVNA